MHILSVIVFLVLIALTLIVTARAAKKVRTDKDFYAAGGAKRSGNRRRIHGVRRLSGDCGSDRISRAGR